METLIKIQGELKAPKNQFNSFGKYKYRSCEDILEAVKPLCVKNDALLTISDKVTQIGSYAFVEATATFIHGEFSHQVTASARHAETKKGMDDSQITGTASSYARKYALNGLFCIDDTKDADTQKPIDNTKDTRTPITEKNFAGCVKWMQGVGNWDELNKRYSVSPIMKTKLEKALNEAS